MAVHCLFPYKKKRPSNETAAGWCSKMGLYTREVKLGNLMFQSVVDTEDCISQVKTNNVHRSQLQARKILKYHIQLTAEILELESHCREILLCSFYVLKLVPKNLLAAVPSRTLGEINYPSKQLWLFLDTSTFPIQYKRHRIERTLLFIILYQGSRNEM